MVCLQNVINLLVVFAYLIVMQVYEDKKQEKSSLFYQKVVILQSKSSKVIFVSR